jgi:thiol-disulfide isomerase/thioredoxin
MMRIISIAAIALACVLAGLWIAPKLLTSPSVEPPPLVVEYLPDFTLPDLNDQPRSIREWSGRSRVINFWATWCAPCRREMPLLQSLQDERSDGSLQVIGVALDNPTDVKRFITQTGVTYPILYGEDEGTIVAESLGDDFIGLPFSAFIAPGGEILALIAGELQADELDRLVAEMDLVASGEHSIAEARERLSAD